MNKDKYTFIDLFAGCGGLSLGMNQAGFKCVWAVEIDENASETYRHNLGNHLVTSDVRDVDVADVPDCDVLVGGFPCQPFSISGLQAGFDGKDGDLFYQCVRFINAKRPKVFMLENVSGFATLQKGYFLNTAISILSSLGYHVSWQILDCSDYSIPQTRKRILILGNRIGRENIYPTPTNKKISVKEAIDDIWQNPDRYLNNEPMRHSPRIVERFSYVEQGETALDAMRKHPELGNAKITKQCYRRMIETEPAPTVVANFVITTIHYSKNRNLTAREAARLQTFPDTFEFKGYKTRMSWQKSLSQFEQIGNAVPPELARLMGNCIKDILEENTPAFVIEQSLFPELSCQINFGDIPVIPMRPQQARGKSHSNRGRNSKYSKIYEDIERLIPGESTFIPDEVPEDFFVFLPGAMSRRGIRYEVKREGASRRIVRLP